MAAYFDSIFKFFGHGPYGEPFITPREFDQNCKVVIDDIQKSIDQYKKDRKPIVKQRIVLPHCNGYNENANKFYKCKEFDAFISKNSHIIRNLILYTDMPDYPYGRYYNYKISNDTLAIEFND